MQDIQTDRLITKRHRWPSIKTTAAGCFMFVCLWQSITLHAVQRTSVTTTDIPTISYQVIDDATRIMGGSKNVVAKRVASVSYRLFSEIPSYHRTTNRIFSEIEQQTNLVVQTANPPHSTGNSSITPETIIDNFLSFDSNLTIIISDSPTMLAVAKGIGLRPVYQHALETQKATCFFAPSVNSQAEIKNALVFIRNDLSQAMINTCLHEEIYQSFGLFNDADGSDYFSFNNKVQPKLITRYDRILLETLYNPSIRPGSPVFHLLEKFNENLRELTQLQTTLLDQ